MKAEHSPSYDNHELVSFADDKASGLRAIIAVHNTNLGPAVGGCRMFPYASDAAALEDVLRLSRGMTYKSALAGLPMGGGKAVIIGDHRRDKSPELLRAMGRFIDSHGGKYITAEDSGTGVADMKIMGEETQYVSGVSDSQNFGGDPSPFTALGVFHGIQAALKHKHASAELDNVRVAIQGAGAVGHYLAKHLIEAGAKVYVADVNAENLQRTVALGAIAVGVDEVLSMDVDVLAPCAMGAVLNDQSIAQLRAPIVAGGANNQLAQARHAQMLLDNNVLYAPDFVINAGGIIEIYYQSQANSVDSTEHVRGIGETLEKIFELSRAQQLTTAAVAEQMAESIFNGGNDGSVSDAA